MTMDAEDNHHKMMTGTETEMDNHNHKTKTVVAVGAQQDNEHGTRMEGTGDDYSTV